jgi:cytoskeletal protein RodZ
LADVEAATRIRQKYLEAFETGAYDELPAGAVSRGFLRIYARYLGIDVEQALALYKQESGDHSADVTIAEPGSPRFVDYRPLEVELSEPTSSMGWLRWLFALLVVGAVAVAAWWYINRNPGLMPSALLAPLPTATPTQTMTPWIVTATPQPPVTVEATLPAPTSDLLLFPTPTVPPTITPTPRPTATPELVAGIVMDVEAEQRSWLRVVVDGELAEEGVLRAGDTRSWVAEQAITLRTGNAAGIRLTLNGEDLGTMGGVGEVVERTWIVDQGEVTEAVGPTPTPLPTPTSTATPSG